ncbi:hypothetical protein [Streptomyces sp. NBC_00878]|uniref:hypothetical protein n=1 Tax=Streptomyces sp. NBC_00878 TaxID=2975854 RepID=UPI00225763A6|nr:hypothetical protein [Streptomyces sp. NBC_00878]MCX4911800.1 hypothetical protein [Streptomyces sp. NBC_00878]
MTTTTSKWEALQKRLDAVKRPTRTFRLCEDSELRARYLEAKEECQRLTAYRDNFLADTDPEARSLVEKNATEAQAAADELKKVYDRKTIVLTFQALERQDLEKLQAAHPATEEDESAGREWHMETFAPAVISAASLDGMPVEAAAKYLATWSSGDAHDLWQAAWSVQLHKRTDLGKG